MFQISKESPGVKAVKAGLRFSCGLGFRGKERDEGLVPSFKVLISSVLDGHLRRV